MENQASYKKISPAEWKALIEKELKSTPYDSLRWHPDSTITAEPAYTAEDIQQKAVYLPQNRPAEGWLVAETIQFDSLAEGNKQALHLLMNGVNELIFEGKLSHPEDLKTLLKDIELQYISIFFNTNGAVSHLPEFLTELLKNQKGDNSLLRGGTYFDPISTLLTQGNWVQNQNRDFETCGNLISDCIKGNLSHFSPIAINATVYHNAGAEPVEELACALAHANEYLNWFQQNGINPHLAHRHLHFRFASGRGYFAQLAKIRAFRPLWANLCAAYGIAPKKAASVYISCETSLREQSLMDAHNNLLRATTQAMSAVLGGCNSLLIHPFDSATGNTSDFSKRIARNIQLILNEESFLGHYNDVSSGSYLIDNLSKQMMEQSWKRFQEIEAAGGLLKGIFDGNIQQKIAVQANHTKELISSGKIIYVGVNKYLAKGAILAETKNLNELRNESKQIETLKLVRATEVIEQNQEQQI
jgi:methylmalonyl-CoA mutase